jgi:DNA topoisomerase-3
MFCFVQWLSVQGQQFTPSSFAIRQSATEPPPPLSEADLIAKMNDAGIGTDATIAQHIETIQKRNYAVKQVWKHIFGSRH